jgi:acyl-CoA thioester hydrolase
MRDAYLGLILSLAVDAFRNEIGFDAAYRESAGCTLNLLEDHKYYLREVKEGARGIAGSGIWRETGFT